MRNAWWSARDHKKAKMSQQLGHDWHLVKELRLRLVNNQASKPPSFSILPKNKSILSNNTGTLQCWAEHFLLILAHRAAS